jgi:cell division protein FtsL
MTPISIAPRVGTVKTSHDGDEPKIRFYGVDARMHARPAQAGNERQFIGRTSPKIVTQADPKEGVRVVPVNSVEESGVSAPKPSTETLEKVVRRIPTLYVIALFGVIVLCAVLMIWNTLQVNALTVQKTHNEERIAQTEQRLIKLRAEEMQLSAPSRIRDLAKSKFGMVDVSGEDLVIVR